MQLVTPNRMRGVVSGLYILSVNLMGNTLGPLLVGLLTDFFFKDERQLRYSLCIVGSGTVPFVVLFMTLALKPMSRAIARGVPD